MKRQRTLGFKPVSKKVRFFVTMPVTGVLSQPNVRKKFMRVRRREAPPSKPVIREQITTNVQKKLSSTQGGGANTKVPDTYGVGGCFRDPKHKSNMYTIVQQRGVSIFYPESQKYKWYFCTHIS